MVNNCATAELLNDEVGIRPASVVLNGHLDNSLLDQEHAIGHHVLLANEPAFLVGRALHAINELLLGLQSQFSEVGDLIHFEHQPQCQFVLILENLLLKEARE